MIEIKEVISASDRKEFVNFQFDLYKGNKYWVPPMKNDELKQLSKETNPAFDFCDARFWTAWKDGKCVGRIGAIINRDYNEKTGKKYGRFSRYEVVNDPEVSDALFDIAEDWLKDEGMEIVHGPLGFNNLDNQGLLIDGFDYLPSIASVMHYPYMQKLIEDRGFEKENDWVEYRLKIEEVPDKATRLVEIIKKRNNLEVIHFKEKADMTHYLKDVFHLLNKAFDELPYVTPFSDKIIEYASKKYMDVLQPQYIVVIKKDGELVAFIVGLPSLSKAMQKAKGKLFPFGFMHIMKALKHPEDMDLLLTGVDPHYQK